MTLRYTLDQVRDREVGMIGTIGPTDDRDTPWWGLADPTTNDCLGFQLERLGIRGKRNYAEHLVRISVFRKWTDWDEVPTHALRPGDLALENWDSAPDADHIEWIYSIDHAAGKVTTISANTGPAPGVKQPRGVWKKTRDIGPWLIGGVRPPYKPAASALSTKRRADIRLVGSYLNEAKELRDAGVPQTGAGDIKSGPRVVPGDGIDGPLYWWGVQMWGRVHGKYGTEYLIDKIPGPRTRQVEAMILTKAKAVGR